MRPGSPPKSSPSMSPIRRKGAESNARAAGVPPQPEDRHRGDGGRRRGRGSGFVVPTGGFGQFAPAGDDSTVRRVAHQGPCRGTVAGHGPENRAGEEPNRSLLQRPL